MFYRFLGTKCDVIATHNDLLAALLELGRDKVSTFCGIGFDRDENNIRFSFVIDVFNSIVEKLSLICIGYHRIENCDG